MINFLGKIIKNFDAWKKGLTGYPIVDAGMRELRSTGWMHNRVRMIVDLSCKTFTNYPIEGEVFKNCLLDYMKQITCQDGSGLQALEQTLLISEF